MTTSTTQPERPRSNPRPRARRTGFTFVEVMSGMTLSTIVLAGVLSTFLTLGRSGANAISHMTMDAECRRALNYFSRDAQMASNAAWNGGTSVTLTVPDNYVATANLVTYGWDNDPASPTFRCFYRMAGAVGATNPRNILARNVSGFSFSRFDRLNVSTTDDASTKRVLISMQLASSASTVPNATDRLSASFILRNKPAS